jgi:hypothetical protein
MLLCPTHQILANSWAIILGLEGFFLLSYKMGWCIYLPCRYLTLFLDSFKLSLKSLIIFLYFLLGGPILF